MTSPLGNIDPNFHDWELINGMCQDCTAFWRTRAVKRSRGKTDLSFLTCSNHQEPCGQRFYFRVGAVEFLIQTSGSAIRNSTVLPAGNGVAHWLRLRSVEGDFCNFDQIFITDGDARQITAFSVSSVYRFAIASVLRPWAAKDAMVIAAE